MVCGKMEKELNGLQQRNIKVSFKPMNNYNSNNIIEFIIIWDFDFNEAIYNINF